VLLAPGANAVDFGTLLEGDANDNNVVELHDFSILATAFGTGVGQPGFDPRADFNESTWIDIADFSLLSTNYGQAGDIPTALLICNALAGTPMTMWLSPDYHAAARGDTFTVDIRLDPKGQAFQGVAAFVEFDPFVLQVVDEEGQPASGVSAGADLPLVLSNTVDNTTGQVTLACGVLGSEPPVPAGEFVVGTIRFKALGVKMDATSVTFLVQENPPRTGVTDKGLFLPVEVVGMQIRIADVRVMAPVFMTRYSGQ
jgi:hypothetical protein